MICTQCGNSEGADAAYCSNCGAPLVSRAGAGPRPGTAGPAPATAGTAISTQGTASPKQGRDPYQEDYERMKAAGFPRQPPQPVPATQRPASSPRPASNPGPALIALGVISLIASVVLQAVKISQDGVSLSASQVNAICQSALGQFGQSVSNGLGYATPQAICGKAATIEDWKGITLWLGIGLILAGVGMLARRAGWAPGRGVTPHTNIAAYAAAQQSREAKLAEAERAEANAARLRAEAAQMQAGQPRPPGAPGSPFGRQGADH